MAVLQRLSEITREKAASMVIPGRQYTTKARWCDVISDVGGTKGT